MIDNYATATGSICPKGWKLPNVNGISEKGSFAYLLQQYGVQSSLQATSSVNGNTYNIALSPLFWVRGGLVYSYDAATPFRNAGSLGRYWSSRAYSNTSNAYFLDLSTSVSPSGYNGSRYSGYSLRCLIPTP